MMVLDVCHASFAFKMDDAANILTQLSLATFPGENVRNSPTRLGVSLKLWKEAILSLISWDLILYKRCATLRVCTSIVQYKILWTMLLPWKKAMALIMILNYLKGTPTTRIMVLLVFVWKCEIIILTWSPRTSGQCSSILFLLVILERWPKIHHQPWKRRIWMAWNATIAGQSIIWLLIVQNLERILLPVPMHLSRGVPPKAQHGGIFFLMIKIPLSSWMVRITITASTAFAKILERRGSITVPILPNITHFLVVILISTLLPLKFLQRPRRCLPWDLPLLHQGAH